MLLLLARDEHGAIAEDGAAGLGALRRREAENKGADHEDHPVAGADDDKGERQADGLDQGKRYLGTNQTADTEAADGQTGAEAFALREPFLESRYGTRVSEEKSYDIVAFVNVSKIVFFLFPEIYD